MKKRRLWLKSLLRGVLPLFLTPALLFAQQRPAGVVTALQGKVQLTRAAKQTDLRFKDGVLVRDVIDTQEKSLARILFGGKSTVTVRELSRLEVREEMLPTGAGRTTYDLSDGAILVNVARQLMRPGDEVQIRTPNAVAAVRGTPALFAQYNSRTGESRFALVGTGPGTVDVIGRGLQSQRLSANQGVEFKSDPAAGTVQGGPVRDVPANEANQILQESQIGPTKKDEANQQQTAQNQTDQATQLVTAVVEAITGTKPTTDPQTQNVGQETAQQMERATTQPSTDGTTTQAPTTTPVVTAPVTPDVSTAANTPDVQISGTTRNLASGETLRTFTGTTTRSNTSPVVQITGSTVSGPGNLIEVASGANASLAGPLLKVTNSGLSAGTTLLDVAGILSSTGTTPFLQIDPTTVTSGGNLISIGETGSLSLSGQLLTDVGGTFNVGGDFLRLFGGTLTSTTTSPLITFTNSTINVGDVESPSANSSFVRISTSPAKMDLAGSLLSTTNTNMTVKGSALLDMAGGAVLTNTTTSPLINLSGGSLTLDQDASAALVRFSTLNLGGPFFSATNAALTAGGGVPFLTFSNFNLTSGSSSPFINLSGGSLTLKASASASFLAVAAPNAALSGPLFKATNTNFTTAGATPFGVPFLTVRGAASAPTSLTVGGPIFDLTNSRLNLGADPLIGIENGIKVTTSSGPVIKISGESLTADALAKSDGKGNTIDLTGSLLDLTDTTVTLRTMREEAAGSTDKTTFNLAANEPLIKMADSNLTLTGSGEPPVSFGVTTGTPINQGGVALIATNTSGMTKTLSLAGPALELSGVNLTDPNPQIQLTNMTVTQSGSDSFVEVSELPVTMTGQLLKATGSTLTQTGSNSGFLLISETNLTSSTTNPLIESSNSSAAIKGDFVRVGSQLITGGDLVKGVNGSSLTVNGGTLISALSGGLVLIPGSATVDDGPSNSVDITNTIAPTGTISGIPVSRTNNGFISLGPNALAGSGPFRVNGAEVDVATSFTGSAFRADGAGTLVSIDPLLLPPGPFITINANRTLGTTGLSVFNIGATATDEPIPAQTNPAGTVTITALDDTTQAGLQGQGIAQLTGPTISVSNATLNGAASTGPDLITVSGTSLAIPGSLLQITNSTLDNTGGSGDLLFVNSGGILKTFGTEPLIKINPSTVKIGGSFAHIHGILSLSAPLLVASSPTTPNALTAGAKLVEVEFGTLSSSTTQALIQLTNSPVTLSSTFDGSILVIGCGECGGKVNLAGPLLSATNSNLNLATSIVNVLSDGTFTSTTTSPLVSISGGTHTVGTGSFPEGILFDLSGSGIDSGTGLGNNKPLQTNGKLFEATDGAQITVNSNGETGGGHALRLDTALLEATAPIISLLGTTTTPEPNTKLTTGTPDVTLGGSTIELIRSKVTSVGPVVALDRGLITVNNGPLINLTQGSNMTVTGDLLSLVNGSKINVVNGPLIKVEGNAPSPFTGTKSTLSVSGALVNFGGSVGNLNQIIVNNSIPVTANRGGPLNNQFPVNIGSGSSITIGANPVKNPLLGTITVTGTGGTGTGVLIQATGGGAVNITAP